MSPDTLLSGTTNVAGTLSGSGTLGTLNVNSGGKLSPGNSVGTINSGATAYNSGGTYVWQINNATGSAGSDPAGIGTTSPARSRSARPAAVPSRSTSTA